MAAHPSEPHRGGPCGGEGRGCAGHSVGTLCGEAQSGAARVLVPTWQREAPVFWKVPARGRGPVPTARGAVGGAGALTKLRGLEPPAPG